MRGCGGPQDQQGTDSPSEVVASVGKVQITRQMLDQASQGANSAQQQFATQGKQLADLIDAATAVELAQQQGIQFDKATLIQSTLDAVVADMKRKLGMPPTATEKDVADMYKKLTGQEFSGELAKTRQQVEKAAETEQGLASMKMSAAPNALIKRAAGNGTASEEEIAQQLAKFKLQYMAFGRAADGKPRAEKALDALKAGGSFETVGTKFAEKPGAQTETLTGSQIYGNPAMRPLLTLQPGHTSQIIEDFSGPSIYKLLEKTPASAKDLAAKRAETSKMLSETNAAAKVQQEIEKAAATSVKWGNEGYHALYDLMAVETDFNLSAHERSERAKKIIDRALGLTGDPRSADVAVATAYLALGDIPASTDNQQTRIRVLEAFTQQFPEIDAKTNLVAAYIEAKDKSHIGPALIDVAQSNSVHTDDKGKTDWLRINGLKDQALKAGLIEPADAQAVEAAHKEWAQQYAQEQAFKAQQAAEQKRIDEENRPKPDAPKKPAPGGKDKAGAGAKGK